MLFVELCIGFERIDYVGVCCVGSGCDDDWVVVCFYVGSDVFL